MDDMYAPEFIAPKLQLAETQTALKVALASLRL
jgi:hypothetical protein